MQVFTYILTHDSGFAPNPFWGFCTLACCKPAIRRSAKVGDLIVGLTPKGRGHQVAYFMEVAEVLTYPEYWRDARFAQKVPRWNSPTIVERCGDNCYRPIGPMQFHQLPSCHSHPDGSENGESKATDLSGRRVLIGQRFAYFGRSAGNLPSELSFAIPGRGHRCRFTDDQVRVFRDVIAALPTGVHGAPARWKDGDTSYNRAIQPPLSKSYR
jgi:hypothetical protein